MDLRIRYMPSSFSSLFDKGPRLALMDDNDYEIASVSISELYDALEQHRHQLEKE